MNLAKQLLARLHSKPSTDSSNSSNTQKPDVAKIIHDALASAGLGSGTAQGAQITGVIDDALAKAGLLGREGAPGIDSTHSEEVSRVEVPRSDAVLESTAPLQGQFLARTFTSPAGTLAYKLYVPRSYNANSVSTVPLLMMLHGCTQSPDDFAAGTRMNVQADLHGFLVAYPAQTASANANKCWNWFRPQDQRRDGGEPALITGMTAHIGADFRVDRSRMYVAGLSAGAAMAVVLGRTYSDVFAAVGAHSGLPYRAAHDVASAFAAMRSGAAGVSDTSLQATRKVMPTIVFHGDRDQTVAATNGEAIIAHQTRASGGSAPEALRESGTARGGRRYSRTTYSDASGRSVAEDWRVHGGGHAWMGGSKSGTYTDPQGPDASAEMVRFFLQQTA